MRYQSRPRYVEAFYISDVRRALEGQLDPNSAAIAGAVGYLAAMGVKEVKVYGEQAPFGLAVGSSVVNPGEWLVIEDETIYRMTDSDFREHYVVRDGGDEG